jgi:Predicted GTPase, probable translation factor
LGLITFFTTGEDETRGWTIREGSKAPEASGAIHSDFQQKFIRAEVVHYNDFVKTGGWSQARQKGLLRVEGKEYVVKDGDILVVRHG